MTLLEGDPTSIGGYRLERRLGAGGMGVVFLGRSVSGRQLAIKVVRPELVTDEGFRIRFGREVEAARQVSGAFTAPVVDADADAEPPWLATLFVPGPSLHEHITTGGPLAADAVRQLAAGLVEALRDIHRGGLIHRDLKPANVLLADDGPRVIDFGIARAVTAAPLTSTGVLIGTPGYMAPELFRTGNSGAAGDVFALGAVLVFAATGHGPFDGGSAYGIGYRVVHEEPDLAGLDPALRPLVEQCLAKEPEARPTVEELLAALSAPLDDLAAPAAARTDSPPPAPSAPPVPAAPPIPPAAGTPTRPDTHPAAPPATFVPPAPAGEFGPPPTVTAPTPGIPPARPAGPPPGHPTPRRPKRTALLASAAVLAVAAAVTVPLLATRHGSGDHPSADAPAKGGTSSTPSSSHLPDPGASALPDSAGFSCAGARGSLNGAGSALVMPVMERWTADFQQQCPGATLNYSPTGANAGLTSFLAGQTDFAIDDTPLDAKSLQQSKARCGAGGQAVDLPLAATLEEIVYNVPGVTDLVLDAPTLAKIFNGKITHWNDPALATLNPGTALPSSAIVPVNRRDSSSSNRVMTTYLSGAAASAWPYPPGTSWPGKAGVSVTGSTGVLQKVTTTEGGIGYADLTSGLKLSTARIATGAGQPVPPNSRNATAFLGHAHTGGPGGDLVLSPVYGSTWPNTYPLALTSYAVVCSKGNNAASLATLKAFLAYVTGTPGRSDTSAVGRAPMPDPLVTPEQNAVKAL
ncbi:MAG: substrate-binding domain-containing protein, partial [Actinomycetia bacterium]|nr:substrate-binding domain-containing protein [Actinomycetes bacterium]